jgi:hypothetical protein
MVEMCPSDIEPFLKHAKKQGFIKDEAWAEVNPLLRSTQLRLIYKNVPVDVLLPRDAHDRSALKRRIKRRLGTRTVWIPTPEDFILQKLKVGRPRDFEDALIVYTDYRSTLDGHYLSRWVNRLGLIEELAYLQSISSQDEG